MFLNINLDLISNTKIIECPSNRELIGANLLVNKNIDLQTFYFEMNVDNIRFIFPDPGINLLRTSLDVIKTFNFEFIPDKTYSINVEYSYNLEKMQFNYTFVAPRPKQLYSSWQWNGRMWIPPKPFPLELDNKCGINPYQWNEDLQDWELIGGYEVE
jgi:hypothetical protein